MKEVPKIGSLVRLNRGDTSTLYLVTGNNSINEKLVQVKAVHELDCKPQIVDISTVRQEVVADETHKKIIENWLLTRNGSQLAKALTR
jgi:hypothetical protein